MRGPQVLQLPRVRAPTGSPPPVRSSLEQVRDIGWREKTSNERERSGEREKWRKREVEREMRYSRAHGTQIALHTVL